MREPVRQPLTLAGFLIGFGEQALDLLALGVQLRELVAQAGQILGRMCNLPT